MTISFSRRELLLATGASLFLAGCGVSDRVAKPESSLLPISKAPFGSQRRRLVLSSDPAVQARENLRKRAGSKVVKASVKPRQITAMIGGKEVQTFAFGDRPGAGGIRVKAGDVLEAEFVNGLSAANTVHWHGLALRNDMDGVHGLTQDPVEPGGMFAYRFTLPDPGTYWFHPHMGLELDRGLYASLIVEDPNEPLDVDIDTVLMLDDWLDGHGKTAQQVLEVLEAAGGHSMAGMKMGDSSNQFAGDVAYPLHVINGRGPMERDTVQAKEGQRIRLRIINAGSDTAYRFAVDQHRLTVTHADGFAVEPVDVDTIMLGMGERYDVVVTAKSGAFTISAVPEGKNDPAAEAVLRTAGSLDTSPAIGIRPAALTGRLLKYSDLRPIESLRLPPRTDTRTITTQLSSSTKKYEWGFDGRTYANTKPVDIQQGERLRIKFVNATMMFHPIHLHGHTFNVVGSTRKDTVSIAPMQTVAIDIEADNPGQWMIHCHNTYHLETGMATVLSYSA